MDNENPHAGQGPVLLDIGGDIGALIVRMPAELAGVEIEIRPVGAAPEPAHDHEHEHEHEHGHPHHPHVAVVARPIGNRPVHSAVFADLHEGGYELYERQVGTVQLRANVRGGEVSEACWPGVG